MQNTSSKQSLSASEDYYYSLSERGSSGESDSRSQRTVIPYTTPPSRNQATPAVSHEQLRSRTNLPLSPIEDRSRPTSRLVSPRIPSPRLPSPPNPDAEILYADDCSRRSITPEVFPSPPTTTAPINSTTATTTTAAAAAVVKAQSMEGEQSPPTPGVDDTPYIRFAIEQLTRDEEVRGSRQYLTTTTTTTNNRSENYPVERIVSGEAPGRVTPEQQQQRQQEQRLSYVSRVEEQPREERVYEYEEQFQVQPEERSYCKF